MRCSSRSLIRNSARSSLRQRLTVCDARSNASREYAGSYPRSPPRFYVVVLPSASSVSAALASRAHDADEPPYIAANPLYCLNASRRLAASSARRLSAEVHVRYLPVMVFDSPWRKSASTGLKEPVEALHGKPDWTGAGCAVADSSASALRASRPLRDSDCQLVTGTSQ